MRIRLATSDDLPSVVAVKVEALRPIYEPMRSEELARDYDVGEQTRWLAHVLSTTDADSPFLVGVDANDVVVGWIRMGCDGEGDESSGEIRGLFVRPASQGEGIGRKLFREGCRALRARGFGRVKVQTLAGSPACGFYEGLGGRYDGDVPFRASFDESVYRWDDVERAAES